ncbi:MAG: polysaccharide biosynthesis tyrosine autokinase [Pirellulaceae bacterium]
MSDAVIEQPRTNGQVASNPQVEAPAPQSSQFDIVQILWRWKWLPILGSIIGAGLGFLYFSQQPATYQAYAMVQVVNSMPMPTRNSFFEPADKGITRADESMVIRSQAVLLMAVKKGKLNEQKDTEFEGLSPDEIVALLKDEYSPLVIEPADKDDNTTLIRITYISENAEFASKVVNGIVEGYSEYLEKEYKSVGDELSSLLSNARVALTDDFQRLGEEMMEYQAAHPDVLWNGENTSDHFAETFRKLDDQLTQFRVDRELLEAVFNRAKAAIDAGRPAEPILLMLSASGNSSFSTQENWYGKGPNLMDDPEFEYKLDTLSHKIEVEQLHPLQIKMKVFMDKWGEGHPQVSAMQKEIALIQQQVQFQRESERKLDNELSRIKKEAEASGGKVLSIEERLSSRMTALAEQIVALKEQEKNIQQFAQENLDRSKEIGSQLNEFRYKNQELEAVKELLATYVEKIKDMDLMPKVGERTLKKLDMPPLEAPFYGPKVPIYLLGGAAVGFILLSGIAVLMDLADRSYRNPSEISADLNVNVLGHIPVMDISKVKKSIEGVDPSVCSIHHSKGRVSEAYRTIRTGLYFSNRGKALKVIQVTSPVPGDGKSTLSCNMAVTMAQSGRRVLLIDADLRRPRVAKIFGIDSAIGVAAVVSGKAEIDDAILAGPVPNLSILPGGKRPTNPAEILSSERFKNMIDMLRDKFDVIIIDTPPLLAVSDPGAVAGVVDGVVLTMRLRRNVKPLAARQVDSRSGWSEFARCRHQRRLIRSRLRIQLRLQRLPLRLQVR